MGKKDKKTVSWSREALSDIKRRITQVQSAAPNKASAPVRNIGVKQKLREPEMRGLQEKSDEEVFLEAMSDVRELPEFRSLPVRRKKVPANGIGNAKKPGAELDRELLQEEAGRGGINLALTDEYMEWTGPGVRKDICSALHEGRIPAQDRIDLHGLTVDEARVELEGFIRRSRQKGLKCVNVVHGRGLRSPGGPLLKKGVRQWIESGPLRKMVMAYATAPAREGGPGATYLLIR